jgi:hypothetical protein
MIMHSDFKPRKKRKHNMSQRRKLPSLPKPRVINFPLPTTQMTSISNSLILLSVVSQSKSCLEIAMLKFLPRSGLPGQIPAIPLMIR